MHDIPCRVMLDAVVIEDDLRIDVKLLRLRQWVRVWLTSDERT